MMIANAAGIYYTPGSLKAQLCVRGKQLLRDFCRNYGVEQSMCGKLIVAQQHQVGTVPWKRY